MILTLGIIVFIIHSVEALGLSALRRLEASLRTPKPWKGLAPTLLSVFLIACPSNAGVDVSKLDKWLSARKELVEIDKSFDEIVEKRGGDGIRVRLGTVYKPPVCEPALCNFPTFIDKFMISNGENIDLDLIDEPAKELARTIQQADFLAYSANFADAAGGGGATSTEYLGKSRVQIKRAEQIMGDIIKLLQE